jgi:hypothetical protein
VRTALFHHHCPLLLVRAAPVLTDAHNTSLRALPPRAPPLFIWWLKHGSYNTGSHTSQNQLGCRRHRRQYLRYCTQPPPQCPHPKAQRAKTKPAMKPAKGPTSNLSVNICSAVLLRDTNVTMFTNEGHKLYTNNRTTKAVDKRYSVELRRDEYSTLVYRLYGLCRLSLTLYRVWLTAFYIAYTDHCMVDGVLLHCI